MISNAYDYYMSMYGNKIFSRYDSHKRSDLKSTYNRMVSINRKSPLYKIDSSEETQQLAIDIKETARQIKNLSSELTEVETGILHSRGTAVSDNEDVASAEYVDDGTYSDAPDDLITVDVMQTAGCQINTGNYLPSDSQYLMPGSYSFDLNMDSLTYEFQFNVNDGDTTHDIQSRICKLINNSSIGVHAEVLNNYSGDTAIELRSSATGSNNDEPVFFVSDINTSKESGSVDLLGLNNISQMPYNAIYSINGVKAESTTDTIHYNNVDISINGTGRAHITFSEDDNVVAEGLSSLISNYNKAISLTQNENGTINGHGRLYNEFTRLARSYSDVLSENGFILEDDGKISIDPELLDTETKAADFKQTLDSLSDFRNDILSKASQMYNNPMEYVNKKIVAYKNPANTFYNPYSDSAYAGMIFDGYY